MLLLIKGAIMPYHYTLTEEERANILLWAKEGFGYTDISKKLDNKISKQRVEQICKKHKIKATDIKRQKKKEEFEAQMVAKWGKRWKDLEHRKSFLYSAMREKFRTKKSNCIRVGKEFSIDFGDIEFPTHCPILGIELDYFTDKGHKDNSPSFDRINPELDYVKGNVAIISMRANRIKNNGTAEEHEKIAKFMRSALQQLPEG
jgi:hypothetical protein